MLNTLRQRDSVEQANDGDAAPPRYRVVMHGVRPGIAADAAGAQLVALFKRSEEQMRVLLATPRAIVKKDLDLDSARQYQQALQRCGCACVIEADGMQQVWGDSAPDAGEDFSGVILQRYFSPATGIVFNAPEAWVETADEQTFQLRDPQTNMQCTASGFDNPGRSVQQWADTRFAAIAETMPHLRLVTGAHRIMGADWGDRVQGIAAEYQGVFPDSDEESHYLVVCLRTDQVVISLTICAHKPAFAAQEAFYRWLLLNQLDVADVSASRLEHDAAMQRWLKHNKPEPETVPDLAETGADNYDGPDQELKKAAAGQKLIIAALLLSIALLVFRNQLPGLLATLCSVAAMCLSIAGLVRVSDSMELSMRMRILLLLLLLVPLVNVFAMFALSVRTGRHLKAAALFGRAAGQG